MHKIFHIIQSIDTELSHYIGLYGRQIYIILFIIIFAKTAYVVLTFLPGDATLFASGAIAAIGHLNFRLLLILFFIATVTGDAQNYFIGNKLGHPNKKTKKFSPLNLISKKSIEKTNTFLITHGKFAIMFSRFVPLLSTTLPFFSGFTHYSFKRFITYNMIGAALWTLTWVSAGYVLGNISWVDHHLSLSLLGITFVSFIPPLIVFAIEYSKKKKVVTKVLEI
ncbi:DedA family protein [Psychrobacillus glaciei]|uniref:DedA family protein n=1 Tax=Psychrobacillus glaciei TaxID=2283160 RepID=UPI00178C62CF|nr:VTT domain-containing protein [Psychrobacillus glaciei]